MPEVTLGKATYYPLGSHIVHPSGTVLEVSEVDEKKLRDLGVVAEEVKVPVQVVPESVPEKPEGVVKRGNGFPELPHKTAPVGEWKEYARQNGIKLAGLTKRNEIMGFVTKTVNESV